MAEDHTDRSDRLNPSATPEKFSITHADSLDGEAWKAAGSVPSPPSDRPAVLQTDGLVETGRRLWSENLADQGFASVIPVWETVAPGGKRDSQTWLAVRS